MVWDSGIPFMGFGGTLIQTNILTIFRSDATLNELDSYDYINECSNNLEWKNYIVSYSKIGERNKEEEDIIKPIMFGSRQKKVKVRKAIYIGKSDIGQKGIYSSE